MNFDRTLNYLNSRPGRIISHSVFWVTYMAIITFFGSIQSSQLTPLQILHQVVVFQPLVMLATYLTIYLYLPAFLIRERYLMFLLLNILTMVVLMFADRAITLYYVLPHFFPDYQEKESFFRFSYFGTIISIYIVVATATTIKMLKYWFLAQQQKNQLEKQNLISELALLRSQINPHFLFNTLNNIEGLIHLDQKKASDSLIRLSTILRYMLYDSSTERVPLDKEIGFLQDFIELQNLRMVHRGYISFVCAGDTAGVSIAPMLLVPLVENAVKHGDKNSSAPGVFIRLEVRDSALDFKVSNHVNDIEKNRDLTGGIGLKNLVRRLDLIYPGRYEYVSTQRDGMFLSNLVIRLS